MLREQNLLMIDWTILLADLCSPARSGVIHHSVVHLVGLSVEPAKQMHSSSSSSAAKRSDTCHQNSHQVAFLLVQSQSADGDSDHEQQQQSDGDADIHGV